MLNNGGVLLMVLFSSGGCVYVLLQAFKNTIYTFGIILVYLAPVKKKKKKRTERKRRLKRVFLPDLEVSKLSVARLWSLVCSA